jgi:hypothetical protein
VAVEDLLDTGEYETLYNLRVADHHTYFVGSREWGFSVWAHNACVYQAVDDSGQVRYVGVANRGISRTLTERLTQAEARQVGLKAKVIPGTLKFSDTEAEAVEQALIKYYGRQGVEPGGVLLNVRPGVNVNPTNTARGNRLLWEIGYWDNPMFH